MEFNKSSFLALLAVLKKKFCNFNTVCNVFSINDIQSSFFILRHDVDRLPLNALDLAKIEKSFGIKGSYYFRVVPESFNFDIIKKIEELGHEIGYHYEDVDLVIKSNKLKVKSEKDKDALIDMAYESFCNNLEKMRQVAAINTICMHGSPLSKFDNKLIWQKYDYKKLGIIAEPYFDIDWNEFAYFTDTGRKWNSNTESIRDKVNSKYKFNFKSTKDIIDNIDKLPNKVMFTIHPERWTNNPYLWTKQLVLQNIKNVAKKIISKNHLSGSN